MAIDYGPDGSCWLRCEAKGCHNAAGAGDLCDTHRAPRRISQDDYGKRVQDDARALWAVRVLDAWVKREPKQGHETRAGRCYLWLGDGQPTMREADSEDAARIAAAEAVFPELPESERARLGVRP